MAKVLHKIIEEKIKTWEIDNISKTPRTPKGNPFPVITISREFGALGAALANHMGDKLGFKTWDKDILKAISEKLGSDKKYLESLDENRRETIEDVIVGFLKPSTNAGYIRTLNQVVRSLEEHGNGIIVGRGANYICTDPKAFHLRVVSPLPVRTRHIAEQQGISKGEAQALITKKDQERAGFINHHFKKDVANASDYDLILNSSVYSLDEMMKIAMLAYEKKTGLKLVLHQ